ncbi:thioredoxin domain-containing protein 17-like [Teleopsis dalmanni]|uniref:thioredoxin domain-containing protein 17-like n=1 Tax=Teleopsis dalmanni TaxID=139649 RepID=UPI0018CDAD78|nr:thioredoxin domain-containing protein 17-like [Teleopsis dalmanni]
MKHKAVGGQQSGCDYFCCKCNSFTFNYLILSKYIMPDTIEVTNDAKENDAINTTEGDVISKPEQIKVAGYEDFRKTVEDLSKNSKTQINIYFTGEKMDGVSWCPDCNDAEPEVKKALQFAEAESVFVEVDVGNREFWKDMKNPFRLDNDIKLMVIPTLLRWKRVERLDGEQCGKSDLLQMFFEENSD